ncbi:10853_t:CDS:2 [Racocetra fulgida]|uniref:10853_t:CDS:1 n=1 Tax=Racocetra fulgida TaxID=60492 RepID=A0A9N8ZQG9_9GLOM|nr:10853_t:CDS:2 [Racocetra fulgida]
MDSPFMLIRVICLRVADVKAKALLELNDESAFSSTKQIICLQP